MNTIRAGRLVACTCLSAALLIVAGCGGDSKNEDSAAGSKSVRAAALSLQQAMDSSSRAVDDVRGTRDSLERLRSVLQPAIAQTNDVIGLLTPKADAAGAESMLLKAAREQRSFLQYAADATGSRSRGAANSAMARTRSTGRRASTAYSDIAQKNTELAGLLPSATTFNTGRLRDAVQKANRGRKPRPGAKPPRAPTSGGSTGGGGGGTDCGGGVSVNSVTSCPFGNAVRDEFQSSGGGSSIEVFSPVTKKVYTMNCSSGAPTVCSGGNGAVVTIR